MDTIGQILRAARERKRISLSQAAAKTHIKIQNLEMMERDDFSKMPAPAYARGFIRMYADFLGIDSGPLVQAYIEKHQGRAPSKPETAAAPVAETPAASADEAQARARGRPVMPAVLAAILNPARIRRAAGVVAVLFVVWALVVGLSRCVRSASRSDEVARPLAFKKGVPAVIQEPPEPYLQVPDEQKGKP